MGIGTFVKSSSKPTAVLARRKKSNSGDLILVAVVFALCIFGLLMVFSASTDFSLLKTYEESEGATIAPYFIFTKQVLLMILGAFIAVFVSHFNYHIFPKLAVPMMIVSLASLIAVLLLGENILGSRRTFIGGSIQPAELAKLVTIIYLAVWLYSKREHLHDLTLGLIPMAIILGTIVGLIILEPDLSAAATIFVLGGLLFFLAGGDLKQIFILIVIAMAVGWLVVQFNDNGQTRLAEYLTGLKDPLKSSEHMLYSLEAMVNGKFFGAGIGKGVVKVEGLPLVATDSIFAVIVEELGLVGAMALVTLYGMLIWRGIIIAERAPDMLGKVLAGGLTFWIGIEALMNMAVLVGLLPFAGNNLPFISAGGSNLISMLTAIGLLVGISRQEGKKTPETVVEQRRSYSASADLRRGNRRRSLPRARRP